MKEIYVRTTKKRKQVRAIGICNPTEDELHRFMLDCGVIWVKPTVSDHWEIDDMPEYPAQALERLKKTFRLGTYEIQLRSTCRRISYVPCYTGDPVIIQSVRNLDTLQQHLAKGHNKYCIRFNDGTASGRHISLCEDGKFKIINEYTGLAEYFTETYLRTSGLSFDMNAHRFFVYLKNENEQV